MGGSTLKRLSLVLANVLLPVAVLVFAAGFFPYKPFLSGLATFEDAELSAAYGKHQSDAVFDRVIFMVVDALRSDFVYGHHSGFDFTQSLIRSGAAIPFTAHATPPTVTMPRVKALTTGSVPSFLDLILNFAESDTSSSLAAQDTWLAQIRAKGGRLVFYGDDTWLKLFPGDFFARADGTSSFFVSDFTEVDNNVTRHVPEELGNDDWHAMVMHYLGLDHIGHKTGPQGPNMLPKQQEMDGIVKIIFEAMETQEHLSNTLLVLAGDHGMNAGGNHGGSGPGETEPALLFASPKFRSMEKRKDYECPTLPKEGTEFHYYTKLEQSDVVPALAGLMGLPISKNSLGVFIPELAGVLPETRVLQLLLHNAEQIHHIVSSKYGHEGFDKSVQSFREILRGSNAGDSPPITEEQELAFEWAQALTCLDSDRSAVQPNNCAEEALYKFLTHSQEAMSSTASSYNIPLMLSGIGVTTAVLLLATFSTPSMTSSGPAGAFLAVVCLLYGALMFASSYVEEEQQFWYWITPAWIAILVFTHSSIDSSSQRNVAVAVAGIVLFVTHRCTIRWNQTGQKHAGASDIVHTYFPEHHIQLWLSILATYFLTGLQLHRRTFAGLLKTEVALVLESLILVASVIFKLNFTQADAPELVQGLAIKIREWSEPFSLVMQARLVFGLLALSLVIVVLLWQFSTKATDGMETGSRIPLPNRLHPLLTLFLITQTRAPNVPLFLALYFQHAALVAIVRPANASSPTKKPLSVTMATTALLFSHVYYFAMGGSNSISSIDLSNAYNGVSDYNIVAVGVLLFAGNWTGPIWWCSGAVLLMLETRATPPKQTKKWIEEERRKLVKDTSRSSVFEGGVEKASGTSSWADYVAVITCFVAVGLLAVMASCTALRTHLFIWTVFSPKYLYAMAWACGWHLIVNVFMGGMLWAATA